MFSTPRHLLALARAGYVLAREGVFAGVDPALVPPAAALPMRIARLMQRRGATGGRLAAALTRLGPSYVKLGQFLATRPDIVGIRVARELESLQDRLPPFEREKALAAIEISLGRPVSEVFAHLGDPVAAASIAQVHRGRVVGPDGEREVAVKVLRPGIRGRFARDLSGMRFIAGVAERFSAEARRLKARDVVETLARSVAMEMDLRLEAAALSELAENRREDADFRVPSVDWDRTGQSVLTTEWVDGTPLSDLGALDAAGHDRPALARILIQSFLKQAMHDGFFHADLHQGNLFVDAEGRLVAVDCGIMGRLGPKERRFLAEILHGFITRRYRRIAEVHFEAGYVPPHHSVDDFAQAIRAIGEPIHQRRAEQISMAKLLTLLFEVTALFDMRTRIELVMLQKTMIVVEGVARKLDPGLDIWSASEPVVRGWIERNLGPIGLIESAARGAGETGRFLGGVPALLTRVEAIAERLEEASRDGFRLAPGTVREIGEAEGRGNRGLTAAIWVLVFLAFVAILTR